MAFSIFLVSLFCGAYAVITQSYLAREFLVVFLGNEMSLAALLAAWLAGVALGARAARLKPLARMKPSFLLTLVLPAWVALFPVAVTAMRTAPGAIFGIEAGTYPSLAKTIAVAFAFGAPFAAFGGLIFVVLCRVAESARVSARSIPLVYVAEAAGGVAGGVLFTFVLAGKWSPFTFGFAAYLVQAAVLIALIQVSKARGITAGHSASTATLGVAIIAVAGGALLAGGRGAVIDANTHIARMRSVGQGMVVGAGESRYQNITVLMNSGQYTLYGNGEPLFTFPEAVLSEQEAHLVLTEQGRAENVLVIGGGPDYLPAILSYGVKSVDYVELDSAVIDAAKPFLPDASRKALESESVRVHYADARAFVAQAAAGGTRYDAVIVRLPNPATLLLNRLYTREFLLAARNALADDGVFVAPVTLADSYVAGDVGRYAGDIYATMRSVFPEVLVTSDVNSLFFGAKRPGVVTSSPGELSRRFAARGIRSEIYPALFSYEFEAERTRSVNAALAGMQNARINADWHPTTYAANLALWARYSGSKVAGWALRLTDAAGWKLFAALAGLALAAVAAFGRRGLKGRIPSISILSTGAVAMSVTVLLIYAFQIRCGYVYNWMGMIVGAFVAGLAGGAVAGARGAGRWRLFAAEVLILATPLALMGALSAITPLSTAVSQWVILALAALAGLTTGFEFPVAASASVAEGLPVAEAASRLEVADHAGACLGALLTGIVIVPALGVWWTLALLAAIKSFTALSAARAARAVSLQVVNGGLA